MKFWAVLFVFLFGVMDNSFAAVARRGGVADNSQQQTAGTQMRSARSAVRTPVQQTSGKVAARAATQQNVVGNKSANASVGGKVAARAATQQKVIGNGTKVAGATANTVVDPVCQEKFDGCLDSFCMLDNSNGGRCVCSNRNAELNQILSEIEKLDAETYQMATTGVEQIEMGQDADAVIAHANSVANNLTKQSARKSLDLSSWNTSSVDFDSDDAFDDGDDVSNKQGDALFNASYQICAEQIPECGSQMTMLKTMYKQHIRSDCNAFENSLKQQKKSSEQKLVAAQKAMREAALEQLHAANKYDLGQCTIQFKKCMQTTAGCGDDFSKCVGITGAENAKSSKSKLKQYSINGSATKISIAASTYDAIESKKPLCMSVTKSCVSVQDQVWPTFLREVAPELKSAELIAESDLRTSCIGNISACFQKACKDTMDPNDPDGSYDMCLSRPQTLESVCKVQIDPCKSAEPLIMDYVKARLASMRVDSCTTEVKQCLQSDDRCGKDYANCVGLDTDTIIRMCPYDKLTGCQKVYDGKDEIRGDAVYEEIATMVEGIMLNIDNNMMAQCQKAAETAMIRVCGDTENCNNLAVDNGLGARSLEYKICSYSSSDKDLSINYNNCRTDVAQVTDADLGRGGMTPVPLAGVLDGVIYWENVEIGDDGKLISVDDYLERVELGTELQATNVVKKSELITKQMTRVTTKQREKISSELAQLQKNIDNAIKTIESDPTVQYCMTGRQVQGMKVKNTRKDIGSKDDARYPELTKQMRHIIAQAALSSAKKNYFAKYDELNQKMLQDYATLGERAAAVAGENAKDARREFARRSCLGLAPASSVPQSANPPKNPFGKVLAAVAVTAAAVALPVVGASSLTGTALIASQIGIGAGGAAVAGVGLLGNLGGEKANGGVFNYTNAELTASHQVNQWNYKETVTTTFDWESLNCHKCVKSQQCEKTKNPIFGNKYCKDWKESVEQCNDTQF